MYGSGTFADLLDGSQTSNPNTPTSNANTPTSNANSSIANLQMSKADVKQGALHDAFGSYMAESREVMEKLVDAVGYERKLFEKRNKVFSELMKLDMQNG